MKLVKFWIFNSDKCKEYIATETPKLPKSLKTIQEYRIIHNITSKTS